MPVHLDSITHHCQTEGCGKTATHELRDTYNARIGLYCYQHGQVKLREHQEREKVRANR